ncbi:caspase family protein [Kitasatospora saccharophila]|uniref:caspase, EACC1-associated type n=1 Tax=Kitasatospora saccharophila TaxID=407973 RepID=UPI00363989C2
MPSPAGLPAGLTSRAILIGTTSYRDPAFSPLPAVANSLDRMREILLDPELCGWSEDEVTVFQDPENISALAPELRRLIETTDGVLLLYYAGHGLLQPNAQLCLTFTDTNPTDPDVSSLTYEKVRDNLLGCPARVRIVILDCCHAGRATRTLAGPGGGALSEAHLDIEGTYILAAAEGPADVVPLAEQGTTPTSFTRHLTELVEEGVLGGPELLSLGALLPHLKIRLAGRKLPMPTQSNTNSSAHLPFTRNAAWAEATRALGEYRSTMADLLARGERHGLGPDRLADALALSPDSARAYLGGRWIVPEDVLRDYFAVLDAHGCGPYAYTRHRLPELRAIAEAAAANDPDEVPALLERNRAQAREIRELRGALSRERADSAGAEAARAAADLVRTATADAAAREQQRADEELNRLREQVDRQRRQLDHASRYTRALESELTGVRLEADQIARELRVLRRQLHAMTEGPDAPPPAEPAGPAGPAPDADPARTPASAPASTPVQVPVPVGAAATGPAEAAAPTAPPRPARQTSAQASPPVPPPTAPRASRPARTVPRWLRRPGPGAAAAPGPPPTGGGRAGAGRPGW